MLYKTSLNKTTEVINMTSVEGLTVSFLSLIELSGGFYCRAAFTHPHKPFMAAGINLYKMLIKVYSKFQHWLR